MRLGAERLHLVADRLGEPLVDDVVADLRLDLGERGAAGLLPLQHADNVETTVAAEDVAHLARRQFEDGLVDPLGGQREILRGLQGPWSDRAGGSSRAYSSGVSTPLLPWASDPAFSEATRNKIATKQGEFLDWLYEYSKRIERGEFGNALASR